MDLRGPVPRPDRGSAQRQEVAGQLEQRHRRRHPVVAVQQYAELADITAPVRTPGWRNPDGTPQPGAEIIDGVSAARVDRGAPARRADRSSPTATWTPIRPPAR
ncbi:hypothetical protein AMETH_0383 [Amycolatopsis methanolica 239]|uniref:Uncharacterized protein n=1 Tax=Amycolatopsis methanolica 239 TaxID=1068978 RepID=A0A076MNM6_AMYME|nr:hypothetical protein AMETH_0383 [Amycolatopsis methanolica 239]